MPDLKPNWTCGMCGHANPPRNRSRCARCGAVKGFGAAQPEPSPKPDESPAMRQYRQFKTRHPDCILLFRIGDFYETFEADAVTMHKALGVTLTQRTEGVPMAGIPYHQLEVYLRRLIQQGFRCAVCEKVAEPKKPGGPVERAVTRVITPAAAADNQDAQEQPAPPAPPAAEPKPQKPTGKQLQLFGGAA
jgi:hypothetical protein